MPEKKTFVRNDRAVSEVMGVALMIGIVVIMLSMEGAFVLSQNGPRDLPHASLKEWMDTSEDTIYLKHCSGEAILTDELEIAANINGMRYVYTSSKIYENLGNKSSWELGEILVIDTRSEWKLDLKDYDEIDLYIIDTPTKELIQKIKLTTDFRKTPYMIGWISPMGGVTDTSGGNATLSDVREENDAFWTMYIPPYEVINSSIYEEFDFGINPCLYGYRPGDSLSNVTLKIVYRTNDNSQLKVIFKFYDLDDPETWVPHEQTLPEKNEFYTAYINLTEYINTTEDLANFKVRLESATHANSENKEINIDYLGLWIE